MTIAGLNHYPCPLTYPTSNLLLESPLAARKRSLTALAPNINTVHTLLHAISTTIPCRYGLTVPATVLELIMDSLLVSALSLQVTTIIQFGTITGLAPTMLTTGTLSRTNLPMTKRIPLISN